jgi:RNA polymerase sigma-70 factor (ECF subfamily)
VSLVPVDRPAADTHAWRPQDDVPLVMAARTGDSASFEVLYRRHARVVHAVLLGRATRENIEDLVQEVFLTAWRQLGTLRDPAAFAGWIVTIARHLRIDHVRRAARGSQAGKASASHDHGPGASGWPLEMRKTSPRVEDVSSADAAADERLEAAQALEAIRALPEAYRDTLMLRLVEGLTGPEIAARTGLTPDSVRVNLCRGMKLLREALVAPAAVRTR